MTPTPTERYTRRLVRSLAPERMVDQSPSERARRTVAGLASLWDGLIEVATLGAYGGNATYRVLFGLDDEKDPL